MKRLVLALAVSCVACGAAVAAVIPSMSLTTGMDGYQPNPAFGSWFSPALDLSSSNAALGLAGRVSPSSREANALAAGRLRFSIAPPDQGPLRPEFVISATSHDGPTRESQLRAAIRYHLATAHGGTWISASADGDLGGPAGDALRMPLMGFGAWARSRGFTLAGALEQDLGIVRGDTSPHETPPDTSRGASVFDGSRAALVAPERVRVTTAYSTLRWEDERFELETVGGITMGPLAAPRRWAQGSLAFKLSPQVALVAAAGSRSPQYAAIDPAGERHASVAVRISQWKSSAPPATLMARAEVTDCTLRPLGEGRYRVTVRAPGARSVELQGDMTQWQPSTLLPVGGQRWEGMIEMGSGVHYLSLRVDGGAWGPPPRFPSAPDGFSGSVGVVVIE